MKRNTSIDLFRIICAIMVIAIHTKPFADVNGNVEFVATQIIPRIAVPFFYTVIGYFYISKLINNQKPFVKSFRRFLIIYILWSIIYFIKDVMYLIKDNGNINEFIITCIKDFFIFGSEEHLWFFPSLFFSIIVITLANKFRLLKPLAVFSFVFYFIVLLGSSYYELGNKILLINDLINFKYFDSVIRRTFGIAIPFLLQGYWLNIFIKKYEKNNIKNAILLVIMYILFVIEIILVTIFNIQKNVTITIFLYPVVFIIMRLLIDNPLPEFQKLSDITRKMSNFMYYSHPIFIIIIAIMFKYIFNIEISETLLFLLTVLISGTTGLVLIKIDNNYLNKLYN